MGWRAMRVSARGRSVDGLRATLVFLVAVGCGATLVPRAQAAPVEHVIHVSVDGLNAEMLRGLVERDSAGDYANFRRLLNEGASTFNARTDYSRSVTLPSHATMITGRPAEKPAGQGGSVHHGYTNNRDPGTSDTLHNSGNRNLSYTASVFDRVHDNGLSTALYASKPKFALFEQSYAAAHGAEDQTGADDGRDKIDTYVNMHTGSPLNASNMHSDYLVEMASSRFSYTFLCYADPDYAGHVTGWGSPAWNEAVAAVDGYLGDLFALIEADLALSGKTAIILSSDHGGSGARHTEASDPANYTIPFFVWGPGVAAGADLYALNSESRVDPRSARPDYTESGQPIRNGDSANLALSLLGLEAVPGSTINAAQDLVTAR